jgi:hypothetical protein
MGPQKEYLVVYYLKTDKKIVRYGTSKIVEVECLRFLVFRFYDLFTFFSFISVYLSYSFIGRNPAK